MNRMCKEGTSLNIGRSLMNTIILLESDEFRLKFEFENQVFVVHFMLLKAKIRTERRMIVFKQI